MTHTHTYTFNKVAIIGSGTMGAQIAAHFANADIPVVMLAETTKHAEDALKLLQKNQPPPLALKSFVERIQHTSVDDGLVDLKQCDLIIEAIVENLEIKKELFKKLSPHLADGTIIASNTSGLSINAIAKVLPQNLQTHFFGIHFFNPPRYLPLVELIASEFSDKQILHKLEGFLTAFLGKEVVYAKDTPGFIANRIGVFAMTATLHHAGRLGIAPDKVDALTGTLIGKAKSATYQTADLVGLDILKAVVSNIQENALDDPWNRYLVLPDWIEGLIAKNHLGRKTKKGIYTKLGKDILVFDPEINDYRAKDKTTDKNLYKRLKKSKNILVELLALYKEDPRNKYVNFLWSINRDVLHYCIHHLKDIANNVSDIDRALVAGFNWEKGPFALWQETGIHEVLEILKKDIASNKALVNEQLPAWVDGVTSFYDQEAQSYDVHTGEMALSISHPVSKRQRTIGSYEILQDKDSLTLRQVDETTAIVHFKTVMSTISYQVLVDFNECLDYLEENNYLSLILASDKKGGSLPAFCAGANLFEVLGACKLDRIEKPASMMSKAKQKAFELANPDLPKIDYQGSVADVVKLGQDLVMRMKYGPIYMIACVEGLALGGGCEFLMHCDHVVANTNSYIGLVEVGVGILPAFGGCTEMLLRANSHKFGKEQYANQFFEQIATAKVSNSIYEAVDMGYVKPEAVTIVANPKELIFVASLHAKKIAGSNYTPPQQSQVKPLGKSGKANLLAALENFFVGNFMSEHDRIVTRTVAEVFSGEVDDGVAVSEQYVLDLERKHFLELLKTSKTQDRMEYILKNNKPLRN